MMQSGTSKALVQVLRRVPVACLILCITFSASVICHAALAEELPLVRVTTKSGSLVGELQSEDAKTVQVFDFQSNRSVSLDKASVTRIENPITLDDAAGYVGLPAVMGRKISVRQPRNYQAIKNIGACGRYVRNCQRLAHSGHALLSDFEPEPLYITVAITLSASSTGNCDHFDCAN